MSFNKNVFVCIVAGLLIIIPVTADILMNNTGTMINSSDRSAVQDQNTYWITIDNLPMGSYYAGDSFTVTGKTNFPAGHEIVFGAYLSQFATGSPDLLPPTYAGSALVAAGDNEKNTWSLVIDTTRFSKRFRNGSMIQSDAVAGDYTLSIGPSGTITSPFTLVDKKQTRDDFPAPVESEHPTGIPRTSMKAPISSIIPVFALSAYTLGLIIFQNRLR